MVADDDLAILDAIEIMLDFKGYHVTTSSKNTFEKIHRHLPDLLLLDIWMSGEDGLQICKALKEDETTKNLPVSMISASNLPCLTCI